MLELAAWVQILALPIGSFVTVGELPNLPEPLLHHKHGGNNKLPHGAVAVRTQ